MTKDDRAVRHVFVRGKVQGVGFRVWVERQALARGLEGWVRNRSDGSVEAVFAGPPVMLDAMLAQLRKGAPLSRIDRVEEREANALDLAPKHATEKFSLLPTV